MTIDPLIFTHMGCRWVSGKFAAELFALRLQQNTVLLLELFHVEGLNVPGLHHGSSARSALINTEFKRFNLCGVLAVLIDTLHVIVPK